MAEGGHTTTREQLPADAADHAATERSAGRHFDGFDGLRAIAALLVVLTHAGFATGLTFRSGFWGPYVARLDVGVAIFFVISGFLLYYPFVLSRLEQRASPNAPAYLWRRFLRIFPAYWAALTFILFVLPRPDGSIPAFGGLLAHFSLTHIYFEDHVLGAMPQSWTLATEVSFYLFLPLYAWAMRRKSGSSPDRLYGQELVGVAVLYAISVGWRFTVETAGWEPAGMYKMWLPARGDLFALGMFLAATIAWLRVTNRAIPRLLAHRAMPWVSWAVALLAFHLVSKEIALETSEARGLIDVGASQELWYQGLYGAVGFFLIVPVVFFSARAPRGAIRSFLVNPVVAWLGVISYGIYLWHYAWIDAFLVWFDRGEFDGTSLFGWVYPLGVEAGFVEVVAFVLLLVIPTAAASWYLLEQPLLRLKRRVPLLGYARR